MIFILDRCVGEQLGEKARLLLKNLLDNASERVLETPSKVYFVTQSGCSSPEQMDCHSFLFKDLNTNKSMTLNPKRPRKLVLFDGCNLI